MYFDTLFILFKGSVYTKTSSLQQLFSKTVQSIKCKSFALVNNKLIHQQLFMLESKLKKKYSE